MNFSLRLKTPFRDFRTKHKVYITVAMQGILMLGTWSFLSYSTAYPDREVEAGWAVFTATSVLMFFAMTVMGRLFQRHYESKPGR